MSTSSAPGPKPPLTVIMYHYVRDFRDTPYPGIKGLDVRDFEGQLRYLKKHYQVITMEQAIAYRQGQCQLPPNPAILTFDDGYRDHLQYVLPLLQQFNFQGSFYIPSEVILNNSLLDVNKIHFILATTRDQDLLVSEIFKFLDQQRTAHNLQANETYYDHYSQLGYHLDTPQAKFIKKMLQVVLPQPLRRQLADQLLTTYLDKDEAQLSRELYLNQDEMKQLLQAKMHIGSHAHSHRWLDSLDESEQQSEMTHSVEFLKQLGCPGDQLTVAFPYGAYNDITLRVCQNLGFKLGFSTRAAVAKWQKDDPLAMPRLDTNDLPKSPDAEFGSQPKSGN